jgi:hypothetical protein
LTRYRCRSLPKSRSRCSLAAGDMHRAYIFEGRCGQAFKQGWLGSERTGAPSGRGSSHTIARLTRSLLRPSHRVPQLSRSHAFSPLGGIANCPEYVRLCGRRQRHRVQQVLQSRSQTRGLRRPRFLHCGQCRRSCPAARRQ